MAQPILAHDAEGAGDPILFVHAFPFDSRMWKPQREALRSQFRVVTPDLRGFGLSGGMGDAMSLDDHADDLANLLSHLGIGQANVVGLSMGGYISLALARRHPSRVRALVLADTKSTPDSDEGKAGRSKSIEVVMRGAGVPGLFEGMLPKLIAPDVHADVRQRVTAMAHAQSPGGVASALAAMRDRGDQTHVLKGLALPPLLIFGEKDLLTPPDEGRKMKEAAPGSRLVIIPGAGHLSNIEAPAAFDEALSTYLRGA